MTLTFGPELPDYLFDSLTLAADATSVSTSIKAVNDNLSESSETIVLDRRND